MKKPAGIRVPSRPGRRGPVIQVRVQPRASRTGIEGLVGDALKVRLTAAPADGAANAQLAEVLANALGVRKSDIRIVRGQTSRTKSVEIEGVTEPIRI